LQERIFEKTTLCTPFPWEGYQPISARKILKGSKKKRQIVFKKEKGSVRSMERENIIF
jgi:hypothetical protein